MDPCPFCAFNRAHIWIENGHAIAFGDAFPGADGHTLVVPRKALDATAVGALLRVKRVEEKLIGRVRLAAPLRLESQQHDFPLAVIGQHGGRFAFDAVGAGQVAALQAASAPLG